MIPLTPAPEQHPSCPQGLADEQQPLLRSTCDGGDDVQAWSKFLSTDNDNVKIASVMFCFFSTGLITSSIGVCTAPAIDISELYADQLGSAPTRTSNSRPRVTFAAFDFTGSIRDLTTSHATD
jgi:hypothetical protein